MSAEASNQSAERPRVAVFGAGGHEGLLLGRLLSRHPGVRLELLASERLSFTERAGIGNGQLDSVPVVGDQDAIPRCRELGVAVAVLCTPVEVSLRLTPLLLGAGLRVLDLSGAFRMKDAAAFERSYGMRHPARDALARAFCVLPETSGTAALRDARLVANPGSYATAALLALAPLLRHDLLRPGAPLFIDGKSGASGAPRHGRGTGELSLAELEGELRPYGLGHHQQTLEIGAALGELGGAPARELEVVFVPHLVGTRRGLLTTCYGQLRPGTTQEQAEGAFRADYESCLRVHVVPPEEVTLRRPVGTPDAWVGIHVHAHRSAGSGGGSFCAVASLDNLMKGAASQAVQNLNGMLGLADGTGLDSLWSAA